MQCQQESTYDYELSRLQLKQPPVEEEIILDVNGNQVLAGTGTRLVGANYEQ